MKEPFYPRQDHCWAHGCTPFQFFWGVKAFSRTGKNNFLGGPWFFLTDLGRSLGWGNSCFSRSGNTGDFSQIRPGIFSSPASELCSLVFPCPWNPRMYIQKAMSAQVQGTGAPGERSVLCCCRVRRRNRFFALSWKTVYCSLSTWPPFNPSHCTFFTAIPRQGRMTWPRLAEVR